MCPASRVGEAGDTALSERRWHLWDPGQLRCFEGESGGMLFNPHSWQTHRVSPLAFWLVQCLRSHPWSRTQLLEQLGKGGENLDGLTRLLDDALAELSRLHLIVMDPSAAPPAND